MITTILRILIMVRQKLVEVISNGLRSVNNTSKKIQKKFRSEYLDTFIIEIKKLKAFIHLTEIENGTKNPSLPMPLKTLYGYFSIIRNYQVARKEIASWLPNSPKDVTVFYLKNIEDAEKYWQAKALELIKSDSCITCQKDILKKIPKKVSKVAISNFFKNQIHKLKNIKATNDEISIRSIHKILEDIYYNRKYISPTVEKKNTEIICLEQFICQIEELEKISVRLEFLSANYLSQIKNDDEKMKLIEIKIRLIREKQKMIEQLGIQFRKLFSTS